MPKVVDFDIVIASRPLEVTSFEVDGLRIAYVFDESGLSINVMYGIEDGKKRAVGSNSQRAWTFPRNWRHASSSLAKNPNWLA